MKNYKKELIEWDDEELEPQKKEELPETDAQKIARLEGEIRLFKEDGNYNFFWSMNKKQNELSKSLNDTTIKLSGDDKVFERFMKLVEKGVELVDLLDKMKKSYLQEGAEETEELSGIPLIERKSR
jgi:hypothetical protein